MGAPLLFDAVVFDLDGTLVATDRFWIEAATRGARRAFAELRLERALPTAIQWLSLVGTPLEVGFRGLFPDLPESERHTILTACVEEEERMLERDGAPSMPGALAAVRSLAQLGVRIGIASNCSRSYLEHMLTGLELRPFVDAAFCRESPEIESKGDMVERLLARFGTRSAVMVGDRSSDRDAAWENGIPHVHCAFGFAQGDEVVEAEGRIESLGELDALLRRRGAWITGALRALGAFERPGLRIGITGGPAAGKTLFARDAARVLRSRGRPAVALSLGALATGRELAPHGTDPLEHSHDLARLEREWLHPHERGAGIALAAPALSGETSVEPGATLLLEGACLLGSRLRTSLDRLLLLEVPEALQRMRCAGRERCAHPTRADESLAREAALQRELERSFPPRSSAELVLDGSNPLGPPG